MIRVMITDDSAFMRKLLSDIINSDPELEVVATARDGKDLLEKIIDYKPDVITLDISMPILDGISTLKRIMQENPLPVIMISALSDEENTFKCLEYGAIDFIAKTSGIISIDMTKKKEILIDKIKAAVIAKIEPKVPVQTLKNMPVHKSKTDMILAFGASTGGPKAIESILQTFPQKIPYPIVIVQHMPSEFTDTFAKRLDRLSKIKVKEAKDDEILENGTAYVAPGEYFLEIIKDKKVFRFKTNRKLDFIGPTPNIDYTFSSIAKTFGKNSIGIILTGMGNDGIKGMKELKKTGAKTIVQDENSSIVPSMPKNIIKNNCADIIAPLSSITKEINKIIKENE